MKTHTAEEVTNEMLDAAWTAALKAAGYDPRYPKVELSKNEMREGIAAALGKITSAPDAQLRLVEAAREWSHACGEPGTLEEKRLYIAVVDCFPADLQESPEATAAIASMRAEVAPAPPVTPPKRSGR